ncbi:Uncharacterised protein [uncultured archaeon]|nr:Uncharacterised protein [uncultured archaeon]
MWTLQGRREEMFASIAAHSTEAAVRIKTKPSRQLFLRLLDHTAVKEIRISSGLWKTVPSKVRAALDGVGVRVAVEEKKAGRPAKFGLEKKQKALELLKGGKTAHFISQTLGVPTTSIYWWKKEAGMGKKRRKKKAIFASSPSPS